MPPGKDSAAAELWRAVRDYCSIKRNGITMTIEDIERLCADHPDQVNLQVGEKLVTPLYLAAGEHILSAEAQLKLVQTLVKYGGDVTKARNNGTTPLHAAAMGGHLNVVQWLSVNGGDVNKTDDTNKAPHQRALERSNKAPTQVEKARADEVAAFLLKAMTDATASAAAVNAVKDENLRMDVKEEEFPQPEDADSARIERLQCEQLLQGARNNLTKTTHGTPDHAAAETEVRLLEETDEEEAAAEEEEEEDEEEGGVTDDDDESGGDDDDNGSDDDGDDSDDDDNVRVPLPPNIINYIVELVANDPATQGGVDRDSLVALVRADLDGTVTAVAQHQIHQLWNEGNFQTA